MRFKWCLATTVACLSIGWRVWLPTCTDAPLRSDAADYLRSSRNGIVALYLERNSVDVVDFVRLYRDRSGVGAHLWDYLYRNGDDAAIRHFHVPLALYPMALASAQNASDRAHRLITGIIGLTLCFAVGVGLAMSGVRRPMAVLTAITLGAHPAFAIASIDPSPHPLYMLLAVTLLFLWSRFLSGGGDKHIILCAVALGLAVATLEMAPTLALALGLTLVFYKLNPETRSSPALRMRPLLPGAAIFLLTLLAAWPGGILRGGYLKSYGVFAGQAFMKRDEMFGRPTIVELYGRLFGGNSVLAVACAGAVVALALLLIRRSFPSRLWAFPVYAALALIANAGNGFRNVTYASEALVFVIITVGLVIDVLFSRPGRAWRVTAIALAAAMGGAAVVDVAGCGYLRDREDSWTHRIEAALHELPRYVPPGSTVLVNDDWATYAAYLPQYRFEATESKTSMQPRYVIGQPSAGYILAAGGGSQSYAALTAVAGYEPLAVLGSGHQTQTTLFHKTSMPLSGGGDRLP